MAPLWELPHTEQAQRNGVAHRLVARIAGVQLVSAVEGWQNLVRVRRISNCFIEVDETIEAFARPNPRIDRIADLGFFGRPVTTLGVRFAFKRRDCGTYDFDPFFMRAFD